MSKTSVALSYHVPVAVGGVSVDALIDTGATVTLASTSFMKSIPDFEQFMGTPSVRCVTGVGGSNLVLRGEINLPIKIGGFSSAPHRILVVEDSSDVCPFILGLDFLDKYYLVIDTSERLLKYKPPHGESCNIDISVGYAPGSSSAILDGCAKTKFQSPLPVRNCKLPKQKLSSFVDVSERLGSQKLRIPADGSCFNMQPLTNLTYDDSDINVRMHQNSDDAIKRLKAIIVDSRVHGEGHIWTKELTCYKPWVNKLIIVDDLLKCRVHIGNRPVTVAVVPECQILQLSGALHKTLNHAGQNKVLKVMRRKYFHPKFATTIAKVVKECAVCQCQKDSLSNGCSAFRRQTGRPYEICTVDLTQTGQAPIESFACGSPKLKIPAKSKTWKTLSRNFKKFHSSLRRRFDGDLESSTEVSPDDRQNLARSAEIVKLDPSQQKVLGINWDALKFLPIGPEKKDEETVSPDESSELPLNLDNEVGSWEVPDNLEPELQALQPRASTPNWAENLFRDSEIGQDFEGFHTAEIEPGFFGFTIVPPTPPLLAQRRNQDSQSAISELRIGTSLDNVCLAAHSEILQSRSNDVNDSTNFMPMASFELERSPDVDVKTRKSLDCCCT